MLTTSIRYRFPAAVLLLVIAGCAITQAPTGGPKDIEPPRILMSVPQNESVNFTGKSIELEFDEYVNTGGAAQKLVVSPPLNSSPEFKMKGRKVSVQWTDTLLPNTTYLFNFGDGIVDYNEGNPLDSNVFVFSTGPYIDSFSISGRLIDALTLKPVPEVYVMLYAENIDSLPYSSLPRYFGKTDEAGNYSIDFISPASYKIFALLPENKGYLFDLPEEKIAFQTEMVLPWAKGDTGHLPVPDLYLFTHKDSLQYIDQSSQLANRGLGFVFNRPVSDIELTELGGRDTKTWLPQWNEGRDSVRFWFPEPDDYDSLKLVVKVPGFIDTLFLRKPSKTTKAGKGKGDKEGLFTIHPPKDNKLRYFSPLVLKTDAPFGFADLGRCLFITPEDTLILADHATLTDFDLTINYPWKEETTYKFLFPDSALCDRYGMCNDSIRLSVTTTKKADYGELIFHNLLPETGHTFVWELMTTDGKTIRKASVSSTSTLEQKHVPAGRYRVRLIFDRNNNGEWDPGLYSSLRQPEKVVYYDEEIELRPNWINEVTWELKP